LEHGGTHGAAPERQDEVKLKKKLRNTYYIVIYFQRECGTRYDKFK
jgi:hypothetical protein